MTESPDPYAVLGAMVHELGEEVGRFKGRVEYLTRLVAHMPGFDEGLQALDRYQEPGNLPPLKKLPPLEIPLGCLRLVKGGINDAS